VPGGVRGPEAGPHHFVGPLTAGESAVSWRHRGAPGRPRTTLLLLVWPPSPSSPLDGTWWLSRGHLRRALGGERTPSRPSGPAWTPWSSPSGASWPARCTTARSASRTRSCRRDRPAEDAEGRGRRPGPVVPAAVRAPPPCPSWPISRPFRPRSPTSGPGDFAATIDIDVDAPTVCSSTCRCRQRRPGGSGRGGEPPHRHRSSHHRRQSSVGRPLTAPGPAPSPCWTVPVPASR